MTDLTKNPDLRSREKIDDYFGDWKWREGLAELMVPIVGRLYRHGIHVMVYGQSLVNKSPIDIMHAHRFVRQIEGNELSELETYPLLERLSSMDLPDCEVDIGELAMRCDFFDQAPKVEKQDRLRKKVKGRAAKRLQYKRRVLGVDPKDKRKKGPNAGSGKKE